MLTAKNRPGLNWSTPNVRTLQASRGEERLPGVPTSTKCEPVFGRGRHEVLNAIPLTEIDLVSLIRGPARQFVDLTHIYESRVLEVFRR